MESIRFQIFVSDHTYSWSEVSLNKAYIFDLNMTPPHQLKSGILESSHKIKHQLK